MGGDKITNMARQEIDNQEDLTRLEVDEQADLTRLEINPLE